MPRLRLIVFAPASCAEAFPIKASDDPPGARKVSALQRLSSVPRQVDVPKMLADYSRHKEFFSEIKRKFVPSIPGRSFNAHDDQDFRLSFPGLKP
jgi:hypothetical protein